LRLSLASMAVKGWAKSRSMWTPLKTRAHLSFVSSVWFEMRMGMPIRVMNTFTQDGSEGDSEPHKVFNALALHLPEFAGLSRERRRQHRVDGAREARKLDDERRSDLRAAKGAVGRERQSTQRQLAPVVAASVTEACDYKIRLKRGSSTASGAERGIFRLRKRPVQKLAAVGDGKCDSGKVQD
jgi:hypothetical protein